MCLSKRFDVGVSRIQNFAWSIHNYILKYIILSRPNGKSDSSKYTKQVHII